MAKLKVKPNRAAKIRITTAKAAQKAASKLATRTYKNQKRNYKLKKLEIKNAQKDRAYLSKDIRDVSALTATTIMRNKAEEEKTKRANIAQREAEINELSKWLGTGNTTGTNQQGSTTQLESSALS